MIVTSDEIVNSHDRFFKSVFSNKEEAADFLLNYLPGEVVQELNLETLKPRKDTFVDDNLKERLSDLLYEVDTADGGRALVYIQGGDNMPGLAETWFQEGRQEGFQQGLQQGVQATMRETILEILGSRFGQVPSLTMPLID
ncbi:MAG: Rpn family recombination-promoting nuclease/putative transposase [Deltaproteobacteria bacterium]|nr:Rpn family recombination-promoting nuclease/putative transposase [Deltaproteobacteria bacterium]